MYMYFVDKVLSAQPQILLPKFSSFSDPNQHLFTKLAKFATTTFTNKYKPGVYKCA